MLMLVGIISNIFKDIGNKSKSTGEILKPQDVFRQDQIDAIDVMLNNGQIDQAKKALVELNDVASKSIDILVAHPGDGLSAAVAKAGQSAQKSGKAFAGFASIAGSAIEKIGTALANMGLSIAIAFAVGQIISFADEFVNHSSRIQASASEAGKKIQEITKSTASFSDEIAKQKAIINDNNSSIEEITQARQTLHELQNQMIETYGNEARNIHLVTEALYEQGDATKYLEELQSRAYSNTRGDYNRNNNGIKQNFTRFINNIIRGTTSDENPNKVSTAMDEVYQTIERYQLDTRKMFTGNLGPTSVGEHWRKIQKQHHWGEGTGVYTYGNIEEIIAALDDMLDYTERQYESGEITDAQFKQYRDDFEQVRAEAQAAYDSTIDLYKNDVNYSKIQSDDTYRQAYNELQQLAQKYQTAKDENAQHEALESYSSILNSILSDESIDYGVKKVFEDLYPSIKAQADSWQFEIKFNADEDYLKTALKNQIQAISDTLGHTVTKEELNNWNPSSHNYSQNAAYNSYVDTLTQNGYGLQAGNELASSSGILSTESIEELKGLIDSKVPGALKEIDESLLTSIKDVENFKQKFLSAWNRIGKNIPDNAQKAEMALKLMAKEEEAASKSLGELNGMDLSDVAKHLTKLNEVYDKLKKDGEVKWNTIDTKDFKESFGDIKDETGEFQKAFDDFHKVLSSTPNDTKAVQDAFDTLASSYVYNSDCMSLLNENNKDLVIGMLSDNGVLNATEVVNDALARKAEAAQYDAFSENLLAQQGVDLANVSGESATATLEGAFAFLDSANYAEQDQAAIAKLILEQWALNGSHIDTSDSCNALQDLAAMAGVAAGQIIALNNAMAGGTGGVPAGMSADEWDQVYDKEAYFKHEQDRRQQETLEQLRGARERVRLGGGGGGSSSGGGGGGGGGSNKEPSKTDKEFDYVNRALQIMQEQNDELREKVDNQYIILQDVEDNAEEFRDAIGRLGEAEQELNSLGVYYGEDEFTEFLETLDLSETAENVTSNVEEIEEAYDGLNMMLDDTPGYAQPIGIEERMDAAQEKADELQQVMEELFGDLQTQPSSVEGGGGSGETFLGADIKDYDKVVAAAKKYKQALGDVEKAKEKTSKTLDENGTGQLTFIKQLQESDKQLIAAYEHAADSYKTEWEDYKAKILEAFKEDGKGEKYIQDIMFGNLDPEEWERMITYDSNDQTMKDNVELLERAQTAYDHNRESLKSMREWQQKLNDDIQKEYEMRLNIVKAEMVAIESRMNEAQFNLDMKEILGEVVQEADYQALIDIADEQIANYEKQLDVLNEQLDTLDEGEQAWYDCKSQIADCENAIRDCVKQQAEWNDTILRMPVENISRFLGLVKNLGQTLKNWLSVNDAKGVAQTAEQIQTSWDTAFDQISDDELGLMKQLEDYKELLENYDLGSSKFSEVDDEIQSARDTVESLVEEMIELNKQLLSIPIDKVAEMTTYLDGTLSDLQAIQSDYETTINTVVETINRQIEQIQDEHEELQKKIEDEIKPLQDQLDSLSKANDQRDRELQIENALYELEKARQQKTVQVIRDGRVSYEADESAVRNAQQGYDDALYNKLTGDLQDKIDDLNDQLEKDEEATNKEVDALNEILKRWEQIMPDTEYMMNSDVATQFFKDNFGVQNWKELVLAGKNANGVFADERIYQGTRTGYKQNAVEMRDTQRQIDINNLITESLTKLVESFQKDEINSEQLNSKVNVLMNVVKDGIITGQERIENTLSLGDYSNLGSALTDASRQRNDQMDLFRDNLSIAQTNRDQVNEIIGNWADFKEWYDETRKQLYEQYKLIDFIGDTVAKHYGGGGGDDGGNWESVWTDNEPIYAGQVEVYSSGGGGGWDSDFADGDGPGTRFAEGLEVGAVGGMTKSQRFKAIQSLGLKKLDPDEFPAILHLGEGVINRQQQSTMLDNFRQALALGGAGGSSVIQMSFGDITLPSVTNGKDFAESLATQFQPAMNQVFSKIFRR